MTALKKILVAVDGSEPALRAVRLAAVLARATGATLTFAYALRPVIAPMEVPANVSTSWYDAERGHARQLLATAAREAGMPADALILDGSPAEIIAEEANTGGHDLVVIGSRGRNAAARVLLGSVSDRLVHICAKPVLVTR